VFSLWFTKNTEFENKAIIAFFANYYAVASERLPYFLKNGNYIERLHN
jgi:hypothetical protein